MCVPVRLSIRLPFSPKIEGALVPTGSIDVEDVLIRREGVARKTKNNVT